MDRLPTILIVEDDPNHLMLISLLLKYEGYTVIEVTNINDALNQIQKFQYGAANAEEAQEEKEKSQHRLIAIIDVAIPQSSDSLTLERGGINLLEHLHRDYPEIPVILLTVFGEADDVIEKAQEYKAVIIPKPLDDPDQLIQVVQEVLPN